MTPSQSRQRNALLARNDSVLERWPQRQGKAYISEMSAVADGLEALARSMDRNKNDAIERSRTWRFAGNAHFDLGAGRDRSELEHAAQAYERAEAALGRNNVPVEFVKLNYCYGQTLLFLSDGKHLEQAKAAQGRLQAALKAARTHMPEGVAPLEKLAHDAARVVALLDQAEGLGKEMDQIRRQLATTKRREQRDAEAADMNMLFGVLKQQFEKDKPGMEQTRQAGLSSLMERLAEVVKQGTSSGQSLEDMIANRGNLDALMRELQPQAKKPSFRGNRVPTDSPSGKLLARIQDLKMYVGNAGMASGLPSGMRDAAMALFSRIAKLTTWISEAGDDAAKLRRLECDQARALAHEVRLFARRQNVMVVRPVWPRAQAQVDVNRVFFSGSARIRPAIERAGAALDLEVVAPVLTGADYAAARWQALHGANLAVFDLSDASPQVYYELGIALALGTQLLLMAGEGVAIPFDVAQQVSSYPRKGPSTAWLAQELDDALYSLHVRGGKTSGLRATLDYATQLAAADRENGVLRVALTALGEAGHDPIKFANALGSLNTFLGPNAHEIVFPRWPGGYPKAAEPRCFAVMPFRPECEVAYASMASAATKTNVTMVRGDQAEGQEIIESIWQEICHATHVSVDLTGYNLNVCLELGIAHALGRNVLMIGTEGTERELQRKLPNASKWRCHTYQRTPQARFLAVVNKFLKAH